MENDTTFSIKDILSIERKVEKHRTERGDLLKAFLGKINKEREGTKFKAMKMSALAVKLAHIPTKDLWYLSSICKDYERRNGSFSKCLFGSIKVPKI